MKTSRLFLLSMFALSASTLSAQVNFNPEIEFELIPDQVVVPQSPIKSQILFIGGHDMVETTDTYGNPAAAVPAKQWHDFIGFTPDTVTGSQDLGWFSINHERISSDDLIGDGGGMTVFKVRRDSETDSLMVVQQTLADGRTGKFFNVDFVNTVGETGMNCGGINSIVDGRIWTAEEWFRADNPSIYAGGAGVRDTSDYTISGSGIAIADGQTVQKYQNFNWMVEIDPREAVAVRKQYNWGRQPFEGGVVMPDNKTVYMGADDTPGYLTKFVAYAPGDFTSGFTYVYKEDDPNKWVLIDNQDFNTMLNFKAAATAAGGTMFNRLEWVAFNPADGNVYLTETGRDNPSSRWNDELAAGGVFASHHYTRAAAQGTSPDSADYWDYYGRVLKLDTDNDQISIFLEGGPYFDTDPTISNYPPYHLSNPDGLNFMTVGNTTYMIICEDLNGTSNGRMPAGVTNRSCEMFMLNMNINNPSHNDLIRIGQTPVGAEITGAVATPDGKTLLFNSQHPSSANPFPYNNSMTIALTGWDEIVSSTGAIELDEEEAFSVYPNPTSRVVYFNKVTDVALYNNQGKLVRVERNTKSMDIMNLAPGMYILKNADGEAKQLIIQ